MIISKKERKMKNNKKLLLKMCALITASGVLLISMLLITPYAINSKPINLELYTDINDESIEIVNNLSKEEMYLLIIEDKNISDDYKEIVKFNLALSQSIPESVKKTNAVFNSSTYLKYGYIRKEVEVTSLYKPTVMFYTEWLYREGNPTPEAIVRILNASLNRSYNNDSKQFSGLLFYHLEAYNKLFFELNGDFYDNGTTTYTGGGTVNVNGKGSLNFSISYSSNHFKYIFYPYRFIFSL